MLLFKFQRFKLSRISFKIISLEYYFLLMLIPADFLFDATFREILCSTEDFEDILKIIKEIIRGIEDSTHLIFTHVLIELFTELWIVTSLEFWKVRKSLILIKDLNHLLDMLFGHIAWNREESYADDFDIIKDLLCIHSILWILSKQLIQQSGLVLKESCKGIEHTQDWLLAL